MQKLIINADDYGLSHSFNKGIIELAKKGIISSLSVMIKRKWIAKEELKKLKNVSLGLHLEIKKNESIKEIEAQIKKFRKKFNFLPSHLDSHYHIHLTKENLPKIIKLAKKYQLPVRSYLLANRKTIKQHDIKTPDAFIAWHPKRMEILKKDLLNVQVPIIELICHPGYYDKKSTSSYNKQREQELKILKSCEFKSMVKKFKLTSYKELKYFKKA